MSRRTNPIWQILGKHFSPFARVTGGNRNELTGMRREGKRAYSDCCSSLGDEQ